MEELIKGLLKELEGKNLTKKSLFDILSGITIETTSNNDKKHETKSEKEEEVLEPVPEPTVIPEAQALCDSCGKIFLKRWYYTKHLKNNPVCVEWQKHPNKDDNLHLDNAMHILVNNLLEQSLTQSNNLICRWCNSDFTSVGNLHKHFINANVCNRMAFYEFKKLINAIN